MGTKCIILSVILFAAGLGLGFALDNVFYPSGTMGTQLYIGEIEWNFEGDLLNAFQLFLPWEFWCVR